jgi:hypothetical protein
MKTKIYLLTAIAAIAIFASCKEGPEGPQGPAGPAGPQGSAGTNTVVYSNWTNFTAATWSPFNALDIATYNISGISALNQTMLDRGAVKVFIKKTGNATQVFPLPLIFEQTAVDVYNLDHSFALNQITLRCLDLGGSPNPAALLASFGQYRYVLIPGGVAGVAAGGSNRPFYNGYSREQLDAMSYAELCKVLEIPE